MDGESDSRTIAWVYVDYVTLGFSLSIALISLIIIFFRVFQRQIGIRTQICFSVFLSMIVFFVYSILSAAWAWTFNKDFHYGITSIFKFTGEQILNNTVLLTIFLWINLYHVKINIHDRKKINRKILFLKIILLCVLNISFVIFGSIVFVIPNISFDVINVCFSGYFVVVSLTLAFCSLYGLLLVRKIIRQSLVYQKTYKYLIKVSIAVVFCTSYNLIISLFTILFPIAHYFWQTFLYHAQLLNCILFFFVYVFCLFILIYFGINKRKKSKSLLDQEEVDEQSPVIVEYHQLSAEDVDTPKTFVDIPKSENEIEIEE